MWTINSTLKKHLGREIPHFIYTRSHCAKYMYMILMGIIIYKMNMILHSAGLETSR